MKRFLLLLLAFGLLSTPALAEDSVVFVTMGGPNWSAMGVDLIPKTDDTYDIGSSTKKWKDIYIDGVGYFDALDMPLITDGNIPYMQAAGAGFGDSPLSRTDATTVKITGTDPATIYDVSTATDVDYWAGVVSDNDGVADTSDLYQIGKGTVPGTTPLVTVQGSTGNVGIGTDSPTSALTIGVAPSSSHTNSEGLEITTTYPSVNKGTMVLFSGNSLAANVGGKLSFGGTFQGTTDTVWAHIAGLKENAVSGEYGGYLSLYTRANGASEVEHMRIDSAGNIGINTTAPQSLLDVQGPTGTGTATAGKLTLATKELTVVAGDELGRINFNAPLESDGTDAILPGASIWAVAEGDFGAASNATSLVLATGSSEAAAAKMTITSSGATTLAGTFAATSVTTTATSAPAVSGIDSDQDDPDITWKIYANATATGTGAEVADMFFQTQGGAGTAGTLGTFMQWDGSEIALAINGAVTRLSLKPNTTTASPTTYADDAYITPTNSLMRVAGNGGAVTLDTDPTIADGTYDGQEVKIMGSHDTNTVAIADACNTALAGDVTFTLGVNDVLYLSWNAGQSLWIEISRSDN